MSPRDGHLAELRCHCDDTADGHPLGETGCTNDVEMKARPLPAWGSGLVGGIGYGRPTGATYGTCRKCGQRVQVVRIETRDTWERACPRLPGESKAAHHRRKVAKFGHGGARGPLLQIHPGMAPHRHAGQDCPGTGLVPAETRYTPGRRLAERIVKASDKASDADSSA